MEWTSDTHNSLDETQMQLAEWKKLLLTNYILHYFIYMTFLKRQKYGDGEQMSCYQD